MYDPDELNITKEDLLNVMLDIELFWMRKKTLRHVKLAFSMKAFRFIIKNFYDGDSLSHIWMMIIKFMDRLRYYNALHGKQLSKIEMFRKVRAEMFNDGKESISRTVLL